MFSSGRPCLGRRLSVVLDTAAAGPDEPLLFLYPRWAASALQSHQTASFTITTPSRSRARASQRSIRSKFSPCGSSFPFRQQSTRCFSLNAAAKASEDGSSAGVSPIDNGTVRSDEDKINEGAGSSNIQQQGAPIIEPKRPLDVFADIEVNTPARGPITWKSRKRNAHLTRSRSRPLAASARDLTPRNVDFASKLSARDRKKLRYGTFIKNRMENSEKLSQYTVGGWDSMKDILERQEGDPRTVIRRSPRHKELQVPEETIALMSGITDTAVAENIYYIAVRNGCRVHILHPRDGDGVNRKVILSGSERVMELVEEHIKRSQALQNSGDPLVEIPKPIFPILSSVETMRRNKLPVPMIRGVWVEPKFPRMTWQDLLESRPSLSTVKEFAEYIEELTRAWKSFSGDKANQGDWVNRRDLVARRILELFRQDSNKKIFSTAALNQAMRFFCDQELLSTARAVFLRAEHVATADTYNIFLRTAARRQDLKTFRRFLVSMNRAHIRPNPETWLVLLEAMVTPNAKAALVAHLVQKGYMSGTSATRTALQLTIQDSLLVHLENGQSMESFIALIVQTNGANWFSPRLLSQMFSVIARRKDFNAANTLLKFCLENQLVLQSDTLTNIMTMSRKDMFSIVDYALPLLRQPNFRFSPATLEFLFRVAYKGQMYNTCRVLWRYACLYGLVTYKMKEIVLSSLRRNVPFRKHSEADRLWQVNAGKVIIGLELQLPSKGSGKSIYPSQITDLLPLEHQGDPLSYLTAGFKPQGEERDLQSRVAYMLIKRDIKSGSLRYFPQYPLSVMLESAAILDAQWKRKPRPLSWMLQNAIQVPIRKRPSAKNPAITASRPLHSNREPTSLDLYSDTSVLHS